MVFFYPNKLIWLLSCIPSNTPNSLSKSIVESPNFALILISSIDMNSSSFAALYKDSAAIGPKPAIEENGGLIPSSSTIKFL